MRPKHGAAQTALMWAAGEGHLDVVAALIKAGANVNAKSKAGSTPLLFAVRDAQIDTLRYLLDHGANANDIAPDGTSALNVAVVNAFYEAASVLLDYGADPNLPDARASPLHTIAWLRKPGSTGDAGVGDLPPAAPRPTGNVTSLELVKKLLAHGANPNVRVDWPEIRFDTVGGTTRNPPGLVLGRHLLTYNGATAFYVAAKNGDAELMRALAAGGADPSITNRFGITPLMVAAGLDTWEGETPGPFTGVSEAERLEAVKAAVELGQRHQCGRALRHLRDDGRRRSTRCSTTRTTSPTCSTSAPAIRAGAAARRCTVRSSRTSPRSCSTSSTMARSSMRRPISAGRRS